MPETATAHEPVADAPVVPGLNLSWVRPGVIQLTFDRPHRRNALDRPMLDGLPVVLAHLRSRDDAGAVVVTGSGSAFCAGGDLDVIGAMSDELTAESDARMSREFDATQRLWELPQPTIAAVNGPAVGAGLGLALACDIRVAAPMATFSSPFIKMGLVPDFGVSWLLAEAAGTEAALELALTGMRIDAHRALALGLVSTVTDDPLAHAVDLAARVADGPQQAAQATKQLVRSSRGRDLRTSIRAEIDLQLTMLTGPEFVSRWQSWSESIKRR